MRRSIDIRSLAIGFGSTVRGVCLGTLAVVVSTVGGTGTAFAQDGGTRSIFSTIGAGARGISTGRAFVSLADDASAVYWNPATLRNVSGPQITGMYMPLFGGFTGATYTYLGAAYPTLNAGAIGVGFQRVSADFEAFDAMSVPLGTESYAETQLLFGWAFESAYRRLYGRLATGVSFKIANQTLAGVSSTSPGIDVGFRYVPDLAQALSIGVNLQDVVGPEHRLFQEADQTDRTLMLGAGYTHALRNGSAIRVMIQLDSPERADMEFHAGAEYAFSRYVTLRAGIDGGGVAFGLGVSWTDYTLDYAFMNRETAGSSHPVSFTAHYGSTLGQQREELLEKRQRETDAIIEQRFTDRVERHRERARLAETENNLPVALDEWKIVLEYLPGDLEAGKKLEAIMREMLKAQEQANRAMESQAEIRVHFSRGLKLYQENDYARAREEWQAILAIDPDHPEALDYSQRTQAKIDTAVVEHVTRADVFEEELRFTEAMSEWNNVQLLAPEYPGVDESLERIRNKIERQSRSLRETQRRLRVVNLYDTSLQAFNRGEYKVAIKALSELLRLAPNHEEARTLHAMAKRKLTPLTKEEEKRIRELYLAGMTLFSRDQYGDAIRQWEKILEIDPTNESVRRSIEEARERQKQIGSR